VSQHHHLSRRRLNKNKNNQKSISLMKNFSKKNNKIHTHNIETSELEKKGENKFDIHEGRNINPTVFQPWEPSRRGGGEI
jgi:hypothetical protein